MEEQSEEDFCNSFPDLSRTMEYSKNRRFSRTSIIIAEGMFKTVFLGYDHDSGREIAWSTLKVHTLTPRNREKILEDLSFFSKLDHPNLLKLIATWEDLENFQIITITELTTCSIKNYLQNKVKNTRLKVIKSWCKSILQGINYIHSHNALHKNIKCENIFIGKTDGNIRIGIIGSSFNVKLDVPSVDLIGFAYTVVEMCTLVELDYSKVNSKTIPREIAMIDNEKIKEFVNACFTEQSAESLLAHPFLRSEDIRDASPVKVLLTDMYYTSIEELPKSKKFNVIVRENSNILGRHEFDYDEDFSEQFVETLMSKYNLPMYCFSEILNKIEKHLTILQHCQAHPYSGKSEVPTPVLDLKHQKKQTLSINLGIQDLAAFKKLKVDVFYDQDTDTPKSIAEEIINQFQLDYSEIASISKIINDKLQNSESETHSNYSNQDLLDLTQEEIPHLRPALNSTAEFSIASENSSYRSSNDVHPSEFTNSRSISPIEEEDKNIVCGRGRKNDAKEVKQLQEALGVILGFKIQSEGIFCKKTEEQVKILQAEYNVPPTGVVCSKLWHAIMSKTHHKAEKHS